MFAIRNYNNPNSVTFDDFKKDLNKIKCVKRLFRRYEMHGELKVHLILNHIIVMYNVFDDAATPCLLYTSPSPRDYAASRMPSSA